MQHGQINGSRIMDSATVELVTTVQYPNASPTGLFWEEYGLGAEWAWGHNGVYPGCRTQMWYSPDENTGAVVLINGESELGTGHIAQGLFEYAARTLAVPEPDGKPVLPQSFSLYQNYPNPFNPSTTVRFSVPKTARVSLSVYDILGRHVTTLADGLYNAGLHELQWNCAECPTGVYLLQMNSDGFTQQRKMLLMK